MVKCHPPPVFSMTPVINSSKVYASLGNKKLEPDGTEVELVPGFRVIVLTGPCPEIFKGGSNFGLLGYFRNKLIGLPVKKPV